MIERHSVIPLIHTSLTDAGAREVANDSGVEEGGGTSISKSAGFDRWKSFGGSHGAGLAACSSFQRSLSHFKVFQLGKARSPAPT